MKPFILLLFSMFHVSKSTSTFVITWGTLTDYDGCDLIESGDCWSMCESDDSCLIAYITEASCLHCGSEYSADIQSLDQSQASGNKVGFKVLDCNETCPASPNRTFEAENFTLEYANGYWKVVSEVTSSTPAITTTTSTALTVTNTTCKRGGKAFLRDKGVWCIEVRAGSDTPSNILNSIAVSYCCFATGIEDENERDYIIAESQSLLDQGMGAVWILGMHRKSACRGSQANATGCVPWDTEAFEWTDNFTTGNVIMETSWLTGQPTYEWENEDCVQMVFDSDNNITGSLFSFDCDKTFIMGSQKNTVQGYACGYNPDDHCAG